MIGSIDRNNEWIIEIRYYREGANKTPNKDDAFEINVAPSRPIDRNDVASFLYNDLMNAMFNDGVEPGEIGKLKYYDTTRRSWRDVP